MYCHNYHNIASTFSWKYMSFLFILSSSVFSFLFFFSLPDGNFEFLLCIKQESVQFFIWLIKPNEQNLFQVWYLKEKGKLIMDFKRAVLSTSGNKIIPLINWVDIICLHDIFTSTEDSIDLTKKTQAEEHLHTKNNSLFEKNCKSFSKHVYNNLKSLKMRS